MLHNHRLRKATMALASCHCGSVKLHTAVEPVEVTECNCSICRRYGVLWSYHSTAEVAFEGGPTQTYSWDDKSIAFHRCLTCGCVTHWSPIRREEDRMGVNARLLLGTDVLASF